MADDTIKVASGGPENIRYLATVKSEGAGAKSKVINEELTQVAESGNPFNDIIRYRFANDSDPTDGSP